MRNIILIFILFTLILPSYAWFWEKKDKALEAELHGKGYAGSLPKLDKINSEKNKVSKPVFDTSTKFDDPTELKPVPKDNPAFIDIILKKDKTSMYVLDIEEVIPIIEKLSDAIEDEANVQLFVTRANHLTMNLDYLQRKYEAKPESYYESFIKLMEINSYVKSIVQLRKEAVQYQRYLAYQTTGSVYKIENINQQLQYLLKELNDVVVILREEE